MASGIAGNRHAAFHYKCCSAAGLKICCWVARLLNCVRPDATSAGSGAKELEAHADALDPNLAALSVAAEALEALAAAFDVHADVPKRTTEALDAHADALDPNLARPSAVCAALQAVTAALEAKAAEVAAEAARFDEKAAEAESWRAAGPLTALDR
eukprot:364941-Chlamydomonas_euryale.AAC.1